MTELNAQDAEIRGIVQTAERARVAGQRDEARRLLAQARGLAPDHPMLLNALGALELESGDALAARQLLERAVAQDEKNPAFWLNLASAHRRLGEPPEKEEKALDRALALDPRHLPALLQKASLLELRGRTKAAAKAYHNALQSIPPQARLPDALRPALQHAVEAVRANDAALDAFLCGQLRTVRERHAGDRQERFDRCIDSFLGRRRVFFPQPTFLYFPNLPALEFYPREDFAWLDAVEGATEVVRAEYLAAFAGVADAFEPYIAYPEGSPLDQWAELNHSRRWSVVYLWRDGKRIEENLARCPRTAQILSRVPLTDVAGYAPTVFFSVLDAKSRIPAHTGVTNTRLIVHLPLIVPPGCRFRVGAETREWREGQALVFDDSIQHEAWNDSEVPRVVLIFDIWNPYLTPAERDLVRTAVAGIRAYYEGEVPVGAAAEMTRGRG